MSSTESDSGTMKFATVEPCTDCGSTRGLVDAATKRPVKCAHCGKRVAKSRTLKLQNRHTQKWTEYAVTEVLDTSDNLREHLELIDQIVVTGKRGAVMMVQLFKDGGARTFSSGVNWRVTNYLPHEVEVVTD